MMNEIVTRNFSEDIRPKVSVAAACYNYGSFLPELLESLDRQTSKDFEIIVVDDGSTDDSLDVARGLCERYRGRMFITLLHQENQGVSVARNKGLSIARGRYFMYLDPDDRLLPPYFQETIGCLDRSPDVDIVYVGMSTFGDRHYTFIPPDFHGQTLKYWNFIPGYALFRKEVFLRIGGFKGNVPSHEDWDFWLNAHSYGFKFQCLKKPLFHYRIHEKSLSAQMQSKKKELIANIRLNNRALFDPWDLDWARKVLGLESIPPYRGLKALLISETFPPSGGFFPRFLEDLARELGRLGVLTEVATGHRSDRPSFYYNGINLHTFPYVSAPLPPEKLSFGELNALISRGGYDVIIAVGDPRSWPFWAIEEPEKHPLLLLPVIDEETYSFLQGQSVFRKILVENLKRCHALCRLEPSSSAERFFREDMLSSRPIPWGVPFVPPTIDFRKEAGIAKDRHLLLVLSDAERNEPCLEFLRRQRDIPGNWAAAVLGTGTDELGNLKEEVRGDGRFLILNRSDMDVTASAMEAADLLVLPRWTEDSWLGTLYAMSHGLPWIAEEGNSSWTGAPGGVIARPGELGIQVRELLANRSSRERLGEEGFRAWKARFRVGSTARRLLYAGDLVPDERNGAAYIRNTIIPGRRYVEFLRAPGAGEPLVSVIIPTYDRPDQFQEALESVLDQDYQNLEVVVVNDHGVELGGVIPGLKDPRVRYHRNPENLGLAASRNVGVSLALGKYVAYLDDDDLYYPNHIRTLLEGIEAASMHVAYTDSYQVILSKEDGRWRCKANYLRYSVDFDPGRILARNIAPVNCFMHSREAFFEAGGFDESLSVLEDWDLWIRLAARFDFLHLRQITCEVRFREDKGNMSFTRESRYKDALERINRKHEGRVLEARDRLDKQSVQRNMKILSDFAGIKKSSSPEEALKFLEDRVTQEMSPYLEYLCAQACLENGDSSRARAHLQRCLELNPKDRDALNDLAVIEYQRRNTGDAISFLERSLSIDPAHKDSRINLIDICMEKEMLEKASEHLHAFMQSHPHDPEALIRQERMRDLKPEIFPKS